MNYYMMKSGNGNGNEWNQCTAESKRSAMCQFSAALGREVTWNEVYITTAKKILLNLAKNA